MAPKRPREDGSSSSRSFNRKKFINAEAAEKFDTVLAERALVPERGLRPDARLDGDLSEMIHKRDWFTFTAHPDAACIAIVKEFYANAQDTPECLVMVRGKAVSFSRAAINSYYKLKGPAICQFAHFKPDYDKIVKELCRPGTEWKRNVANDRVIKFSAKWMSRYGKIWYAFLCAKLMPSTHVSEVLCDRSGLLYAIITGMDIDVGGVIEASIKKTLKGSTSGGLPHPSLITELCRQAGVKWGAAEPLLPPTTLLNHKLIKRYWVWPEADSHPRGLGYILRAAVPGSSTSGALSASDSLSLSQLATQLERVQRRMDREHRCTAKRQNRTEKLLHTLALRQADMLNYMGATTAAWTSYFSQLHPNADMGNFPPLPVMTNFPTELATEDEESPNTSDGSGEESEDD